MKYSLALDDSCKRKKPFYVQLEKPPWVSFPTKFIRKIIFIGTVLVFLSHQAIPSPTNESDIPFPVKVTSNSLSAQEIGRGIDQEEDKENIFKKNWRTLTVKRGDNLSLIFSRLGLEPQQLHRVLKAGKETNKLKRLMPGQQLKFKIEGKKLTALIYVISKTKSLHIDRNGEQFQVKVITRNLEKRIKYASGSIDTSLFSASQQAGLSNQLTLELASIFGWDIDFALDIRRGDQFSVVYEEMFLDGEKIRDGKILAAKFINREETHRAANYTNPEGNSGYFTPEGLSMRKAFLRTPVAFTRISSRFGRRYHMILNRMRAHKGVDYAAPRGTPIKSTGDGKIIFRGRKKGYGKMVIVSHGNGYTTLYSHMSNFKRGQRIGGRVQQGQTIGYVGSTGLSTGPHLHYEFRVRGVHRNPLKIILPGKAPVKVKYAGDFKSKTSRFLAMLENPDKIKVALNK